MKNVQRGNRNKPILVLPVLLFVLLASGVDGPSYGQGTIVFNNLGANDGQVLVFPDLWHGPGVPLNQDLNFELDVSPGPEGPWTTVRTWLLSDGTATGINLAPGRFDDPSHSVIALSGIAPGAEVHGEVAAWAGRYSTFGDAVTAGAAHSVFPAGFFLYAGTSAAPPASLSIGDLNVYGTVPEPSAWVLFGTGGLGLFLYSKQTSRRVL